MSDNLNDYKERHRFWQNLALTQFSFTNNLLLSLSIGFLVYLIEKNQEPNKIIGLTLILLMISIGEGVITVISRLYDFRVSRHIAYVRQRYFDKSENTIKTLPDFQFPKSNFCTRTSALLKILFCRLDLLSKKEIGNTRDCYLERFNSLRKLSQTLGDLSWKCLKIQILSLFLACGSFCLDFFKLFSF